MSFIEKLFGSAAPEPGPASPEADTIRKIAGKLQRLSPDQARHIAAFAFILSRVAHADLDISQKEIAAMERIVREWGNLQEDEAALVVQIARHQNILFGGTDNFIVTREFKESTTRQQKIDLLHCLFAVSASDDSISLVEEGSIAQISRELGFTHREMIAIRSQYNDKRAVLKVKDKPSGGSAS